MDKATLLSHVTDLDIFEKFFGSFKESKLYCSPLRTDDKNPSFNIFFSNRKGKLIYKDLGGGGSHGDAINFVSELHGIPFPDVINFIAAEFGLSEHAEYNKLKKRPIEQFHNPIFIRKKFEWVEIPFPEFGEQIYYWERYGITKEFLDEYNVKNIQSFEFVSSKTNKLIKRERKAHHPIYLYHYDDGSNGLDHVVRFYLPNEPKGDMRFVGNTRDTDIFGLKQLKAEFERTGRRVLLCGILAGQKDCMALYANSGIRAVCGPSESTALNEDEFEEIQKYSEFQFVLYDPDKAGYLYGQRMANDYQIPFVDVASLFSKYKSDKKIKDPADYYKYILENKLKDKLKNYIYECNYQ